MILLLLACFSSGDDTGKGADDTAVDSGDSDTGGESGDTDTDTDSDTDTDTDTDSDTDTDAEDWSTGITLVDEDADAFADEGYLLSTFEIGTDYRVAMAAPGGERPTFQVLWPASDSGAEDRLAVLMLHGGSLGLEGVYNEENCNQAAALSQGSRNLIQSGFAHLVAREGGVVVGPDNPWCDDWIGRGADDPANPEQYGHLLAEAAYNYVRYGQSTVRVASDRGVVLGTSFGAPGAVFYAATQPGIEAVIADSGFTDATRFYGEEEYSPVDLDTRKAMLDHVAGGAPYEADGVTPSEWWPTYQAWGLVQGLESGSFTVPVFHVWNAQDPLSVAAQHDEVADVLGQTHGRAGIRFVDWDVAHPQPDHTQTKDFESFYAAVGAWAFARGHAVEIVEAERSMGSTVGSVVHARADVETFSDESGWEATAADGPGVLFQVDAGTPTAGQSVEIAVFLTVTDAADARATVGTLRLYESGVEVASLPFNEEGVSWSGTRFTARYDAYTALRVSHVAGGGAITLAVEVEGTATVTADLAVVAS